MLPIPNLLTDLLLRFRTQAVRDLAWLIGAPGLLDPDFPAFQGHLLDDNWSELALERSADWLVALDQSPQPLLDHLAALPTKRLGFYVEHLLGFWFRHAGVARLLAENVVVRSHGITIGELDYLVDLPGKLGAVHCECAVKYYLKISGEPGWAGYVGPAVRDRIDLKLNKLFHRQLPLSADPIARALLPTPPMHTLAFIKGWLFYSSDNEMADGLSADHLRGWWRVWSAGLVLPEAERWRVLPRLEWLSPARCSDSLSLSAAQLKERLSHHFGSGGKPVLLAALRSHDGEWHEESRGFVVPSGWPHVERLAAYQANILS